MKKMNISHLVVLAPIESPNESGNCNVFQEGVTCTVCAHLNSGRMGELRARFEVLGLDDTSSVKCPPYESIAIQTRTQLISPLPSGKQLRLHGDHMEKLVAICCDCCLIAGAYHFESGGWSCCAEQQI